MADRGFFLLWDAPVWCSDKDNHQLLADWPTGGGGLEIFLNITNTFLNKVLR